MSPEQAPKVEELVAAYAEPFACASALGMLAISRAVSASARVVLTGDGGDDVFLGYPRHRHLWLAGTLSSVLPKRVLGFWNLCRPAFPRKGALRRLAALLDYSTGGWSAYLRSSNQLGFYFEHHLLGDRLTQEPAQNDSTEPESSTLLGTLMEYDFRTRFTGEYLTKVDGATMHYALEARSPFLDQRLWEFAAQLPFDVRLHHGRLKSVLRELARRKLGSIVARRSKRGFGIPVQRWVAGQWLPKVEAVFHESLLNRDGWIDAHSALSQLHAAARRGYAPQQLWYLFVLESWLRSQRSSERQLAITAAS
jgi:asparagine synthase (glutamine-hydrolysing)